MVELGPHLAYRKSECWKLSAYRCARRRSIPTQQIGRKGLSNHRWIVGGKLCLVVTQYGLVVAWACDTAFHAAEGDPANLKLCRRGEWEERIRIETVLSMLTLVCH